jgi:ketosteroid isomerase-like protein
MNTHEHTVKQFFAYALEGDGQSALALLDEFVIWIEPGAPDVPFGGLYHGHAGMVKMFQSETKQVQLKHFIPRNYFSSQNLVVVLGSDTADVLSTGKSYTTDWAMFFTLDEGKITRVQTYMDTNAIAKAFIKDSVMA